jgi:hypothetical protein
MNYDSISEVGLGGALLSILSYRSGNVVKGRLSLAFNVDV